MTKEYKAILKDLIKEYELLAKYNGSKDYLRWNVLRACLEEQKEERSKLIGKLYDLKDKLVSIYEEKYECEQYEVCFGISTAIHEIEEMIKEIFKEADSDKG